MKTIILIAHPNYDNSKNIKNMISLVKEKRKNIEIRILSQDGNFDIAEEQKHLIDKNNIIFAFPLWWYSFPWTLKKYIDSVLTPGFGFSFKGDIRDFKLLNKKFGVLVSVGNVQNTYKHDGVNIHTIHEYLNSLQGTFQLLASGSPITQKTYSPDKYYLGEFISWGAAVSPNNKNSNLEAVNQLLKFI